MANDTPPMSAKDLLELPTLSVPQAGIVLGLKRDAAYEAARRGHIPTIKLGRTLRVPTVRLKAMLAGTE